MHVPRLLHLFVCGQTFSLLLCLGIINSAAMNTGGMCLQIRVSLDICTGVGLFLFEVLPCITQRALKTSRSAPGVAGANHNPSSTLPSTPSLQPPIRTPSFKLAVPTASISLPLICPPDPHSLLVIFPKTASQGDLPRPLYQVSFPIFYLPSLPGLSFFFLAITNIQYTT